MNIIADSGSTKTEWCLIDNQKIVQKFFTSGINPYYQNSEEILKNLQTEIVQFDYSVESIHFYGAGCTNNEKKAIVKDALFQRFCSKSISIEGDLLGAARSLCQNEAGIACILGTGSNSCYYDGKTIVSNVSPLGFILGDEGSGAVLGRKLLSDILKKQLPNELIQLFFQMYQTNPTEIMENVYKKPFPNRYVAQFSKFLSKNIEFIEIENIVITSFKEFISRNILQYENAKDLKICFTGSVAFYFQHQLIKSLKEFNLNSGKVSLSPLYDLVQFHINHNL